MKNKLLKKILSMFEWISLGLMGLLFFVVASPVLPTKTIVSSYVVATGSMKPIIQPGSIAFVRPIDANMVNNNDIISFIDPNNPKVTIIHRVTYIETGGTNPYFHTKGDANNSTDPWVVSYTAIKGLYLFSIPYVGYAIVFLRTPLGFFIAIGIPGILMLLLQIQKIKEGIEEEIEKRAELKNSKSKKDEVVSLFD
jgi:signal peptidase I